MQIKYEIRHLMDVADEVGEVEFSCFADGYSIWERQGEGLVMQFHTDKEGNMLVDADWPNNWDVVKSSAKAIDWAKEQDVFSTTADMDDDNAYICEVGKEGIL